MPRPPRSPLDGALDGAADLAQGERMQITPNSLRRSLVVAAPAALLVLPALALAAAPRPGLYSGKTAQHRKVGVRGRLINADGHGFSASIADATLDDGSSVKGAFTFMDVRIGRHDRFDARGKDSQKFGNGTASQRVHVTGRFVSRKRVAGFWTAKAKIDDGQARSCSVRHVRWSARR